MRGVGRKDIIMRKSRTYITDEQKEQARELRRKGVPVKDIAAIFGTAESTMSKITSEKPVKIRDNITPIEIDQFKEVWNKAINEPQIVYNEVKPNDFRDMTIHEAVIEEQLNRIANALERIAEGLGK